ncbi:MAG TPA: energy-dependent translational throttle protein EttA, partial [Acetobacteraceae bacterium]
MPSYQYVYVMKDLTKAFPGGREVFRGITLAFLPGAKIGVLGINGAGKSTLMKIMAGLDTDFGGEAWAAEGARVGYLEQEPRLDPERTVGGNVEQAFAGLKTALDRFNEISLRFSEPMSDEEMNELLAEQADLQTRIDAEDGWDLDRRIDIALDALRCPPAEASVTTLSGGERRRVALCRLLLERPDLLLLDEPTNHLDAESVAWLERTLRDYAGTVMIVTHDRYFLDNVTGWILELERGRGYPFEGNYSSWLEQKRKRLAQEEKEETARQRALALEQEWIAASPRARQAKNRARIQRYEELLAKSQEQAAGVAEIVIPPGPRLGNVVIEAEKLRKGYGNNLLIDDLNFSLPPGGIVGVIGPNGAGKTTLFRMIVGQEQPDSGSLRIGDTVKLGYVDQSRDALTADNTVWQEISGGEDLIRLGKRNVPSRAYVSWFNFKGPDQQKKVGILSGGERNRVHLAKMLKTEHNVILLDEPTNDLDVDTLRALEDALTEFAGCAVIISHDRWFLDR